MRKHVHAAMQLIICSLVALQIYTYLQRERRTAISWELQSSELMMQADRHIYRWMENGRMEGWMVGWMDVEKCVHVRSGKHTLNT